MTTSSFISRFIDLRRNERLPAARAFAGLLLLVLPYTILETARDALLLTKFPAHDWGIVYLAIALVALPASAGAARASARFGLRRALGGGLLLTAAALVALFVAPTNSASVVALYVTTSLVSTVLVPQFWGDLGSFFTVAQGRRLFGPIAAAGVLGAALGSTAAAALLAVVSVKALLLVAAGVLTLAAVVLGRTARADAEAVNAATLGTLRDSRCMRHEPLLQRIALVVIASTAALVTLDYFFKWTVARSVPPGQVAQFLARYYAVLNTAALVAQFFIGGTLVRRIGVTMAVLVTPLLLTGTGVGALLLGGGLWAVLLMKTVDGTLRSSVHRLTLELAYLPVSSAARTRAKPFIDGVLFRLTQATAGGLLLALGGTSYFSRRALGVAVVVLLLIWLGIALTMQRPYLEQLRRALAGGSPGAHPDADPIDFESAEVLVQHLAAEDALVVIGAMDALARRGRDRLIPALVLLHPDEAVLLHALGIIVNPRRDDWIGVTRRLLGDARNAVRMAAARALATNGRLDARDLALDLSPRVQGYASVHLALSSEAADLAQDPRVVQLMGLAGAAGEEMRLGALDALADLPASPRLAKLLYELARRTKASRDWTAALARAVAAQQAEQLIDLLISRLSLREGREDVRSALISFGDMAVDRVWGALREGNRERSVLGQLPSTLASFGTARVAGLLLQIIETEADGMLRYRAIRALGRLVAERGVSVDRARIERLAYANLLEYFRLLALRAAFLPGSAASRGSSTPPTERLLVGLLDDKLRQALERSFRLLKIAYPAEDIHRVHIASLSEDKHARANAGEFLDALLRQRTQEPLRKLLRMVSDDLSLGERAARAEFLTPLAKPRSRDEALEVLSLDADPTLAALSGLHAAVLIGKAAHAKIPSQLGTTAVELVAEASAAAPTAENPPRG